MRDAARILSRLETWLGVARTAGATGGVELYYRASHGTRAGLDGERRDGFEEGIAARLSTARGDRLLFAASTGASEEIVRRTVEIALGGRGSPVEGEPWSATGGSEPALDLDEAAVRPTGGELADWLERCRKGLQAAGLPRARQATGWVEVSTTLEAWVNHRGLRAARGRNRSWALVQPRLAHPVLGRPLIEAARDWATLEPGSLAETFTARQVPEEESVTADGTDLPLVFGSEASAELAAALVRAIHLDPATLDAPVGPGWRIREAPGEKGALFGGFFDDSGFPTRESRLADGERVRGFLRAARGSDRRASFRDRPAPAASHVVVEPPPAELPPKCVLITGITLRPTGSRWILETEGRLLLAGRPKIPVSPAYLSVNPAMLVARCVGGVGSPRSSHRGVVTPALFFKPLPEADSP